jgi:hypothetical protein
VDKDLRGCGKHACSRTAHLQVGDLATEALDGELVPLLARPTLAPLMLQQRLKGLDLPQCRAALTVDIALSCLFASSPPRLPANLDAASCTVIFLWARQQRRWLAAHLGALLFGGQLEQRAALLLQRQLVPPQLGRLRRLLRLPLGLLLVLPTTTRSLSQCMPERMRMCLSPLQSAPQSVDRQAAGRLQRLH